MYFTKVILTSFLIRGYKSHSTQSSLKRKGGGGWRVRLSQIANPTPSDAEFLDEAELLDLGGGGGGGRWSGEGFL